MQKNIGNLLFYMVVFILFLGLGMSCGPDKNDGEGFPPELTIISPTNNQVVGQNIYLEIASSEPNCELFLMINSTERYLGSVSGEIGTYINLNDYTYNYGNITISGYLYDENNNRSETATVEVVRVDLPDVTILTPKNGAIYNTSYINVNITAYSDTGTSSMYFDVSTNDWQSYLRTEGTSSYYNSINANPGTNSLQARIITYEYHTNYSSGISYIYDPNGPSLNVTSPANNATVGLEYTISGTAFDDYTDVSGVFVCVDRPYFSISDSYPAVLDGSNWTIDITTTSSGLHTNQILAFDRANNQSSEITIYVNN